MEEWGKEPKTINQIKRVDSHKQKQRQEESRDMNQTCFKYVSECDRTTDQPAKGIKQKRTTLHYYDTEKWEKVKRGEFKSSMQGHTRDMKKEEQQPDP